MRASNPKFRFKDLYCFSGFKFCESFVENDSLLVLLKRTGKTGKYPLCKKRCHYIHDRYRRRVRDLDVANSKVYIEFTSYQLDCRCGYRGFEELNLCNGYYRYTKRFEEKVVILCTIMYIKDTAKEMRINWKLVYN